MVLEFGDHHGVAGSEWFAAQDARAPLVTQGVRHQIQRLGGVLGEDQLVELGTDELGDDRACVLVRVGGLFGQLMRTTVNRSVTGHQELALGVEDLYRSLAGGPRVEVDERLVVPHGPSQDREVGTNRGHVQRGDLMRCRGYSLIDARHVWPPGSSNLRRSQPG